MPSQPQQPQSQQRRVFFTVSVKLLGPCTTGGCKNRVAWTWNALPFCDRCKPADAIPIVVRRGNIAFDPDIR